MSGVSGVNRHRRCTVECARYGSRSGDLCAAARKCVRSVCQLQTAAVAPPKRTAKKIGPFLVPSDSRTSRHTPWSGRGEASVGRSPHGLDIAEIDRGPKTPRYGASAIDRYSTTPTAFDPTSGFVGSTASSRRATAIEHASAAGVDSRAATTITAMNPILTPPHSENPRTNAKKEPPFPSKNRTRRSDTRPGRTRRSFKNAKICSAREVPITRTARTARPRLRSGDMCACNRQVIYDARLRLPS